MGKPFATIHPRAFLIGCPLGLAMWAGMFGAVRLLMGV